MKKTFLFMEISEQIYIFYFNIIMKNKCKNIIRYFKIQSSSRKSCFEEKKNSFARHKFLRFSFNKFFNYLCENFVNNLVRYKPIFYHA